MAETQDATVPSIPLNSYQTALCITPRNNSSGRVEDVNRLRALYDQAYGKWPAHVNVVYPFVPVDKLPEAIERIRAELSTTKWKSDIAKIKMHLGTADYFSSRHRNTVHLAPLDRADDESGGTSRNNLQSLREVVLKALGNGTMTEFKPHMTIGQTKPHNPELLDSLMSKARLLLPFSWDVVQLEVWVRDSSGKMCFHEALGLNGQNALSIEGEDCSGRFEKMAITPEESQNSGQSLAMESRMTYHFNPEGDTWELALAPANSDSYQDEIMPSTFTVSSYNVLVESVNHSQNRYPVLAQNILSKSALADVLVLQEVCDDFLSYLLSDDTLRQTYPFTSHGPPNQSGIGPLSCMRNIVVLSRWNFKWNWVPFEVRHKGSVIIEMDGIGTYDDDDNFIPLVLTGVHLTAGLTDVGVLSKKSQLLGLLDTLSKNYPGNPCIVAGDFNIATSAFSIEKALEEKRISHKSYDTQLGLEQLFSSARLSDAWYAARTEMGNTDGPYSRFQALDSLYEGEQGATFDPTTNPRALDSAKTGSNRPQRYDRILVKEEGLLAVSSFNMFGFPDPDGATELSTFGSDHWGVRATFRLRTDSEEEIESSNAVLSSLPPFRRAPGDMGSNEELKSCIVECGMLPSEDEIEKRKEVFELVKNVLTYGAVPGTADYETARQSAISMKVVPVGSHGFHVWNSSSDVDVLCISSTSSKTFFALAVQRLSKAAPLGIRILRKVKAASGTMLEVDVRDVKLDIQYCPAANVAERWSDIDTLPPNDPVFDLSIHSLTKLQPYRDMSSLLRTIPDLATFRTAHRFIRAWAKHRGIYAARFGYLGGVHITMMLSRLCKLYFHDAPIITAADIICTFFKHYAEFDWDNEIVYDSLFFKGKKPRYRRYPNEPMVILTLHAPIMNVARAASVPSQRTIVEELRRADQLLSGDEIMWSSVINGPGDGSTTGLDDGAREFLKTYSTYVKINVQYWGLSLAKGSALVGWLESRCLYLLVDLDRKLPEIHTRIWPSRFTSNDAVSSSGDQEYQGCYLIGLSRPETGGSEPRSKDERKQAHDALLAALSRFSSQLQSDEKYFDSSLAWIDATHIKQSEVQNLVLDTREWGDYVVLDAAGGDDSDFEENDEDLIDPEVLEALAAAKQKADKAGKNGKQKSSSSGTPGKKLRPASDILSRLRWDPALDSGDYIIGYEDRFLGEMEMSLENWKGDQTHEEFIPMHRVLCFKRKADGVIVWDRRTRKDELFGSGASSG